jgi:uncharacterized protein YigE (DUF2233 family)
MRTWLKVAVLGAILSAISSAPVVAAAPEPTDPCRALAHEGKEFVVCEFDQRSHLFRLFWRGPDQKPLGYLGSLPEGSKAGDLKLVFATNAGMYHADLTPVGLYIENGRELVKANTNSGPGNFHLKPNGVFFAGPDGVGVLDTATFLKRRPKAEIATQSGPMLVIDGRLHPKITRNGPSEKIRSGVGVRDSHKVVFALSRQPVTFGAFARLFRDRLRTPNALFLDGSISAMLTPKARLGQSLRPFGPMIGVYAKVR